MQSYAGLLERVGWGGGLIAPSQILDDNSTISQTGEGQITTTTRPAPPGFKRPSDITA